MSTPLRIALCGGLVVQRETERIEEQLAGGQGREVFAYLTLNRARQVSRDEVTALLWPDQAPRAPEAALNTILARLRRVLGPSSLGSRGRLALTLAPGSWIDVEAAQAGAQTAQAQLAAGDPAGARGAATAALSLVTAPLLPELAHLWVAQWRSDIDDVVTRLLSVAVRAGLALGGAHLRDAERDARSLIEREPFRESGHALLMEVQAARGDVAEALRGYEQLRTLLRDELGVPPSPRLAALHQRLLLTDPLAPSRPDSGAAGGPAELSVALPAALVRGAGTALAGRHRERAALLAAWSGAAGDRPSLAVVAGEPGIGKSTLVAALARTVHERGAIVLYGQAEEDPIVPYVALVDALRHYLVHVPALASDERLHVHLTELRWLIPELDLLPGARPPPDEPPRVDRLRLYRAAAATLAHAASRHDVLLVLEDLQWADSDTLLVARQLLRERTAHPVRIVFTYRDGEVDADHPLSRTLAEVRRDVRLTRISLTGLDEGGIDQMLRARGNPDADSQHDGVAHSELVRRLLAHTSGNPFFIEEVLRSLDELGTGIEDPARAAGEVPLLPEGVLAVIQERLRRLPEGTREALDAAAVLGDDFDVGLLEAVLRGSWQAAAIDPAVRGGLLVQDDRARGRYRFCHALAREAIYRSTGPGRRSELHLLTARALEQRRETDAVEAAEIAHHLTESGRSETTIEAIGYLREAAHQALVRHAHDGASTHLRSAIELLERDRPQDAALHCELLLELGDVSWQAANPRARGIYQQALAVAQGLGEQARLAEAALGLGGRFYAPVAPDFPYIELLEQTLVSVGETDRGLRTRILGRLAEHLMLVDPMRAGALSETALQTARALGDPALVTATLLSRHAALLAVHDLPERLALAGEQVALARAKEERELEALGLHWQLYDLFEAGDLGAAAAILPRLAELAEELRQPLYRHSALVWRRLASQVAADFERADQLSHEALNLSQGAQGNAAKIHYVAQQMSVVRDVGGVERLLETSRRWPSEGSMLWLSARWLLELECGELTADPERDRVLAEIAELPRTVFWLTITGWLAEVTARTGDVDQVAALYAQLAPHADRWIQLGFNGSFGCVHRPLGLLAARMGRPEEAAGHLIEAARRHAAAGAPALQARALYDHGQAIAEGGASGGAAAGEAALARALSLARACGAARLAQQITRVSQRA